MPLYYFFLFSIFPTFFYLFRFSLNEDILLFFASLIFFYFIYIKTSAALSEFFFSKIEELYSSFADLFLLKLSQLSVLIRFGKKLVSLLSIVGHLQFGLFLFMCSSVSDIGRNIRDTVTLLTFMVKRQLFVLMTTSEVLESVTVSRVGDTSLKSVERGVAADLSLGVKEEQLT